LAQTSGELSPPKPKILATSQVIRRLRRLNPTLKVEKLIQKVIIHRSTYLIFYLKDLSAKLKKLCSVYPPPFPLLKQKFSRKNPAYSNEFMDHYLMF